MKQATLKLLVQYLPLTRSALHRFLMFKTFRTLSDPDSRNHVLPKIGELSQNVVDKSYRVIFSESYLGKKYITRVAVYLDNIELLTLQKQRAGYSLTLMACPLQDLLDKLTNIDGSSLLLNLTGRINDESSLGTYFVGPNLNGQPSLYLSLPVSFVDLAAKGIITLVEEVKKISSEEITQYITEGSIPFLLDQQSLAEDYYLPEDDEDEGEDEDEDEDEDQGQSTTRE